MINAGDLVIFARLDERNTVSWNAAFKKYLNQTLEVKIVGPEDGLYLHFPGMGHIMVYKSEVDLIFQQ